MTRMARDTSIALQRLDRWLWCARFVKSRTLAARLCAVGRVSLGGVPVTKAHQPVRVGDRLALRWGRFERRIVVQALATRRGPASEARSLYVEAAPPVPLPRAEDPWTPLLGHEDDTLAFDPDPSG